MTPKRTEPPFPLLDSTLGRAAEEYPAKLSACIVTTTLACVDGLKANSLGMRVADALLLHPLRGGGTCPDSASTALALIANEYGQRPLTLTGVIGALRQAALLALTADPSRVKDLLPPAEHALLAINHLLQYVRRVRRPLQGEAETLVWAALQPPWRRMFVLPVLLHKFWWPLKGGNPPEPAPPEPPPAEEPPAAPAASPEPQETPMTESAPYPPAASEPDAPAVPPPAPPPPAPPARFRKKRISDLCGVEGCEATRGRGTIIGDAYGVCIPSCASCRSRWRTRVRRGQASNSPADIATLQKQASLDRMAPADRSALVADRSTRPCVRTDCVFPGSGKLIGHPDTYICDKCRCTLAYRLKKGICVLSKGFTLADLQGALAPRPVLSPAEAKKLAKAVRAHPPDGIPLEQVVLRASRKSKPEAVPAPLPPPAPAPPPPPQPEQAPAQAQAPHAPLRRGDAVRIIRPYYTSTPLLVFTEEERAAVYANATPQVAKHILTPGLGWPPGLLSPRANPEDQGTIRSYRAYLVVPLPNGDWVLLVGARENVGVARADLRPTRDFYLRVHPAWLERAEQVVGEKAAAPAPAPEPAPKEAPPGEPEPANYVRVGTPVRIAHPEKLLGWEVATLTKEEHAHLCASAPLSEVAQAQSPRKWWPLALSVLGTLPVDGVAYYRAYVAALLPKGVLLLRLPAVENRYYLAENLRLYRDIYIRVPDAAVVPQPVQRPRALRERAVGLPARILPPALVFQHCPLSQADLHGIQHLFSLVERERVERSLHLWGAWAKEETYAAEHLGGKKPVEWFASLPLEVIARIPKEVGMLIVRALVRPGTHQCPGDAGPSEVIYACVPEHRVLIQGEEVLPTNRDNKDFDMLPLLPDGLPSLDDLSKREAGVDSSRFLLPPPVAPPVAPAPQPEQAPEVEMTVQLTRDDMQRYIALSGTADFLLRLLKHTRGLDGMHGASGSLIVMQTGAGPSTTVPIYPEVREALEQAAEKLMARALKVRVVPAKGPV